MQRNRTLHSIASSNLDQKHKSSSGADENRAKPSEFERKYDCNGWCFWDERERVSPILWFNLLDGLKIPTDVRSNPLNTKQTQLVSYCFIVSRYGFPNAHLPSQFVWRQKEIKSHYSSLHARIRWMLASKRAHVHHWHGLWFFVIQKVKTKKKNIPRTKRH